MRWNGQSMDSPNNLLCDGTNVQGFRVTSRQARHLTRRHVGFSLTTRIAATAPATGSLAISETFCSYVYYGGYRYNTGARHILETLAYLRSQETPAPALFYVNRQWPPSAQVAANPSHSRSITPPMKTKACAWTKTTPDQAATPRSKQSQTTSTS